LDTDRLSGEYRFHSRTTDRPRFQALSADGEMLVASSFDAASNVLGNWPTVAQYLRDWGLLAAEETSEVALVEVATGRVLARLRVELDSGSGPWEPRVAFADDGRRLAIAGADDVVRIWDLPLRKPWGLILTLAAVPPALLGVTLVAVRRLRRPSGSTVS
jgi:hypothetical protein